MKKSMDNKYVRLGYKRADERLIQMDVVPFTNENIKKHIKAHKGIECYATYTVHDIEDFDNSCIVAPLVFDLDDAHQPENARQDALKLIEKLKRDGVKEKEIDIYFSGNKGFHLVIPYKVMRLKPSRDIMRVYKRIGETAKKELDLKTLDTSIFDKKRQLRLKNTMNRKTKLYKIPLTIEELNSSMVLIKKLAQAPRKKKKKQLEVNKRLRRGIKNMIELDKRQVKKSTERMPLSVSQVRLLPCIKSLLKTKPEKDRNHHVYHIGLFFKSNNVAQEDAVKILEEWSDLDSKEVKHAVESAYTHDRRWGCNDNPILEPHCDKHHCPIGFKKMDAADYLETFSSVMDEAKKWMLNPREKTKLTTGYQCLDDMMGGIFEDELIIVTGVPGVGKTEFCTHMAYVNGYERKNKVVFCSQEMPNRMIAIKFIEKETGIPMQKIIKQEFTEEERKRIEIAANKFNKEAPFRFYKRDINFGTHDIKNMIQKIIEIEGSIDLLVIDHLRFIERSARKKDHEEMERIMKELTDIAQDYKVCIVCIAHFQKGDDSKPRPANDLLGGASIRNYVTKILQIWRKEMSQELSGSETLVDKATQFHIQKNRLGGTVGVVRMAYDWKEGVYLDENLKKEDTKSKKNVFSKNEEKKFNI